MKATDDLSHDHQLILKSLGILRSKAAAWLNDRPGAYEDCRALLTSLKKFADRCHHGKEESALFPKLMQAGMPADTGPLRVLLFEHDQARDLMRGMEQAVEAKYPSHFALFAKRYAELLEQHIAKEDDVLFVKANEILSREDDEALLRHFEEIEHAIGEEFHDEFHELLERFSAKAA